MKIERGEGGGGLERWREKERVLEIIYIRRPDERVRGDRAFSYSYVFDLCFMYTNDFVALVAITITLLQQQQKQQQ